MSLTLMFRKERKMELKEYIKKCGRCANKHGWKVTWDNLSEYLMATLHELLDGWDRGWRDNNKDKMYEEVGDCLIRLFHICYDLDIPIEEILERLMKENKKRPFKHGHENI